MLREAFTDAVLGPAGLKELLEAAPRLGRHLWVSPRHRPQQAIRALQGRFDWSYPECCQGSKKRDESSYQAEPKV